jgi:predicted flap endonuclease-1-like 5' DNA nuclease
MAFTLNEISLLVIALIAGLLIGLMLSGRGKYKRLWRDEQMAHRQTIRDRDARLAAAPAATARDDGTGRDELTRIRGISAKDAAALHEAGYHRYDQIGAMSDEQQAALEARLGREPGTIAREEWRTQARLLETGKVREHERRYIETN